MTWTKLVLIAGLLSLLSAGLVAFISRAPVEIRSAEPSSGATDASLGASFTDEQIDRHRAFRAPSYAAFAVGSVLPVVFLVLLARGPFAALVAQVQRLPGGWPVHALAVAVALAAMIALLTLPLGYVRHVIQRDWGLSTQGLGAWFLDQGRALLVGSIIAAVSALAFFAIVRWQPRTWWVWGWAGFTLLTVALVYLYPVAIAPLFNRFTPLEEGALRTRITEVAERAGVRIDEVLVSDASKRTTSENAYVAGLGPSKQLVLYDTLLEAGEADQTLFVVAHELGHRSEDHVVKNVALSSLGLLVGFALLAWLGGRGWLWSWAGASGPSDLRALPILLLYLSVTSLVALPLQSGVSRAFERRADSFAISVTGDPDAAVTSFRRLAFANLADLDPPRPLVWALFSHPPIPERISRAMAGSPSTP
jgi:STE24 endopeptidase